MNSDLWLILDIDGVMTDGTKAYGLDGKVTSKSYADVDFTAIKKFKEAGWYVCFMSADETVNKPMAHIRGVDFINSRTPNGDIDKVAKLKGMIKEAGKEPFRVIYVGDDLFDVPIMKEVKSMPGGEIYCPQQNAAPQVRRLATWLNCRGGHGAVMALYDLIVPNDSNPPKDH